MASILDLVKHYQHAIEKYPNDEKKVLKAIDKLFGLEVTVQHLQNTGVGRTVNALRKEPGDVGQAARALVYKWKVMVAAEESDHEADQNNDTTNCNGHGNGKDSDDNAIQNKSRVSDASYEQSSSNEQAREQVNGTTSGSKRKYDSSEEENGSHKKSKQYKSSEKEDYGRSVNVKKESSETDNDSHDSEHSHSSDSESEMSESSEDDRTAKQKMKTEPVENHRSSSKHVSHNHVDQKKEASVSKSSDLDNSKSHSSGSRHSYDKSSSRERSQTSHKHTSSSDKQYSSEKKHKSENSVVDKDKKKDSNASSKSKSSSDKHSNSEKHSSSSEKKKSSSDKHRSSSDKHSSSSEKHGNSSEKHRSSSEKQKSSSQKDSTPDKHKDKSDKSEKHENKVNKHSNQSHKSDKEKHKSSSDKEAQKHKSRESSSSSKEKHSSSSKEKSKESSSSSKEKSSDSHKSDKKVSSHESKSKESKDKTSKKDDRSSEKKSKHKSSSSSSHKSDKSSSKSSGDIPKTKPQAVHSTESDDGIDCGSGASFAEALGMFSPVKPKKKGISFKEMSSPISFNNDLSPLSLLAPTARLAPLAPLPPLEIAALPEISPHYRPRPPPRALPHFTDEEAMNVVISSKNQRTKVYSGNKVIGKIPTLYELCVQVLQEHIDALEFTGGVPYEILKPIVDKATPQQLFVLEYHNPYLTEDTDHLWKGFCEKHFRNKKRQEMEAWREMYIRCQEEQEDKLKSLTANIRMTTEAKKAPIKQTKMAYVDSVVKPPRNIARKQAQHGTALASAGSPAARVAALAAGPHVLRGGAARPAPVLGAAGSFKPKKAPLMAKALQLLRGRKR